MEAVAYMNGLFVCVVALNIGAIFLLWRSSGIESYKKLMLAWLQVLIGLFGLAATSTMGPFARILGFSTLFFFYRATAALVAELAGVPFPGRFLVAAWIGALAAAVGLELAGEGPRIVQAALIATATGLPALVVGGRVLFFRRESGGPALTTSLKGFVVTLFCYGFHALVFIYGYDKAETMLLGSAMGLAYGVAFTLFGPGTILERVSGDRARLETELAMRGRLSQAAKLAALGEMAGGVAHEINTPLAVIKSYSQQIQELVSTEPAEAGALGDSLGKMASRIEQTADRIAKIVLDLRAFAREVKDDPLREEDVSEIISSTLSLCREKYRDEGVMLAVSIEGPSLRVSCRKTEISQVLMNLLRNARDAVQGLERKLIQIDARLHGSSVEIAVTDSGPGVPSGHREKIFQPFYTTKSVGQGTGLGLSVAKGIAEAHGGELRLDDGAAPTRFVLALPAVTRSERPRPGAAAP